jgi:hypothetical protein
MRVVRIFPGCFAPAGVLRIFPGVFCADGVFYAFFRACFVPAGVLRIFPGVFCAGGVFYAFCGGVLNQFPGVFHRLSVRFLRFSRLSVPALCTHFPGVFCTFPGVFRTGDRRELRLVLGCYRSTGSVQNRGVQTPGPDVFHSWCRVGRSSVQGFFDAR